MTTGKWSIYPHTYDANITIVIIGEEINWMLDAPKMKGLLMIRTYKMLKKRRDAGEINGFTLIELLIVIVVLGILAAVVIFALGGITAKSAVAACQADGATVQTAIAAFQNINGVLPTSTSQLTASASSGPFIQSWPNNTAHYTYTLSSAGALSVAIGTGAAAAYTGPGSCAGAT